MSCNKNEAFVEALAAYRARSDSASPLSCSSSGFADDDVMKMMLIKRELKQGRCNVTAQSRKY